MSHIKKVGSASDTAEFMEQTPVETSAVNLTNFAKGAPKFTGATRLSFAVLCHEEQRRKWWLACRTTTGTAMWILLLSGEKVMFPTRNVTIQTLSQNPCASRPGKRSVRH